MSNFKGELSASVQCSIDERRAVNTKGAGEYSRLTDNGIMKGM